MSKKLITILSASIVTVTAIIAAALLFQQQDPTLDDVPFIPASDAITEPVVETNASTESGIKNQEFSSANDSDVQIANNADVIQEQSNDTVALENTNAEISANSTNANTAEDLGQTIVVTISGPNIAKRCVVDVAEPMSVHQVMKHASQQCKFSYVGKQFSGLGFFVDELAGKLSDTKSGKYWIFYVNGLKASVGVSSQQVRAGDVIAWQFENEVTN